jgi:hypothetical protein
MGIFASIEPLYSISGGGEMEVSRGHEVDTRRHSTALVSTSRRVRLVALGILQVKHPFLHREVPGAGTPSLRCLIPGHEHWAAKTPEPIRIPSVSSINNDARSAIANLRCGELRTAP